MNTTTTLASSSGHSHIFLGEKHRAREGRTWAVIWLCTAMMIAEIAGGMVYGSIALTADGLHMSTHAGALLLAALAYTFARSHAHDARFTFGTGKLGDLAGFSSAIILGMIAVLVAYESAARLFAPVPIHFREAIPIAVLGLAVNIASIWLLGGAGHDHGTGHGHSHASEGHSHDETRTIETDSAGTVTLEVFEEGVPPRFRLRSQSGFTLAAASTTIETIRPDGQRQVFRFLDQGGYLESTDDIPEPHAFSATVTIADQAYQTTFEEHEHAHASAHSDHNMRAAVVHVMADAAVSVFVIIGLVLARAFGWLWMDPVAGLVGAAVIASWSYGLIRDTGAILLDMNPDPGTARKVRQALEVDGDHVADLHIWRLGPGHLGAIVCMATRRTRDAEFYRTRLTQFKSLSHVTIEVRNLAQDQWGSMA